MHNLPESIRDNDCSLEHYLSHCFDVWDGIFKTSLVYDLVDLVYDLVDPVDLVKPLSSKVIWAEFSVLELYAVISYLSNFLINKNYLSHKDLGESVMPPPWGPSLLLTPQVSTESWYIPALLENHSILLDFLVKTTKEGVNIVFLFHPFLYFSYLSGSSLSLINTSCYNFSLLPVWS